MFHVYPTLMKVFENIQIFDFEKIGGFLYVIIPRTIYFFFPRIIKLISLRPKGGEKCSFIIRGKKKF